jgi:hypothetical protein
MVEPATLTQNACHFGQCLPSGAKSLSLRCESEAKKEAAGLEVPAACLTDAKMPLQ